MAAIEVKTNGYTADTAKRYLLDTGAIFKNVTYNSTSSKYEGEPLGATVGGAKCNILITLRQPEVDGLLAKVEGNDFIESVEANIEGVLKEWTKGNIAQALFADVAAGDGTVDPVTAQIITGRNEILSTDYVDNICYIGKIAGEEKPVIIMFKNAINTSGLAIETKDKTEAGIPFKFEARADADKPEDVNKIWKIIYPETVA